MKRVVSIVPYHYLPWFSGGQKLIAGFNEYLGAVCRLHVAGTPDNDVELVKQYRFHPLLNNGRVRYANPLLFFSLKRLIQAEQIRSLIIEHPYHGWLAVLLKRATGVQLIVHTHNVEAQRFRSIGKIWWPLLEWYERWVLQQADLVFCISQEDRSWMISELQVQASKCVLVPYGIVQQSSPADRQWCKEQVCRQHGLDPQLPLLFFNGLLDYKPNLDALEVILKELLPRLQQQHLAFQILIAGKRLPAAYQELQSFKMQGVCYAGYVADIDQYTKAADVLLNPVLTGGGVKTKMIEALGCGTSVVATATGAAGVDNNLCPNKLVVVNDGDWDAFAEAINSVLQQPYTATPEVFYDAFYWGNIVKRIEPLLAQ